MWDFRNDTPIYLQIIEQMKQGIVSGAYLPGTKLASVRDLAAEASVNPNTMQKALSELEREGLVYTNRTMGRFITEDSTVVEKLRQDFVTEHIQLFLKKMKAAGYTRTEVRAFLEKITEEEE